MPDTEELQAMLTETTRNGRYMLLYFVLAIATQAAWFSLALREAPLPGLLAIFTTAFYCSARCLHHCRHATTLLHRHRARMQERWSEG